ncbi:MAG TPA: COR domain-containing protein [Lamprocystis sp. (in: g-proteobacteria)]|nr:COR domain-containing protein [Lamprocystis sp. (in: g-proteobacteria)]
MDDETPEIYDLYDDEYDYRCELTELALARIAAERDAHTGELDLADLWLSGLPGELFELEWIESLTLGESMFSNYPNKIAAQAPSLTRLQRLRQLNCSWTDLADLSPLSALSALQYVGCSGKMVTDLTPLAGLADLESLEFAHTEVADLRPLAGLAALQWINCSATDITELTPLVKLRALKHVDCSLTQVADLSPLAGLSVLEFLDCSDTKVTDLSPLDGLAALRVVNCVDAPVARLPEGLVRSPALEELTVSPHPGLAPLPAEVLSQKDSDNCLPRLRAHLADLASGAEPLRDVKVIVLGNGRIGKTQLCRRLRGEPFEPDADSTHGIGVSAAELPMAPGEVSAILNLWDFGGQDLYHGTHALFMRTRAVFLLVWTPGSEGGNQEHGGLVFRNRPLPYWLEYIRHLGGAGSPVILVQNQCDGGRGERANLPLGQDLIGPFEDAGRLFKRIAYSALDDSGRAGLTEALQQAVRALRAAQGQPQIGRNRLAVWDQLRDWRGADAGSADPAARRHRLVPFADFESLCRDQAVHDPASFAEVLHRAGMVWYQRGHFGDRMILDRSWAMREIYALFTRTDGVYTTLRRLGGRFTRTDLDVLLWGRRGLAVDDQRTLLKMMEQSGICFVYRPNWKDLDAIEYRAPDLLPEGRGALAAELADCWEDAPGVPTETTVDFPFLSPSIGRALLSDLGTLAGDRALYWRYGVYFYDGSSRSRALVEQVADPAGYGGHIRIQAKGAGAETLIGQLRWRLRALDRQHGWGGHWLGPDLPVAGGRSDLRPDLEHSLAPILTPATMPAVPEVFISYAWAREAKDPLVDALCAGLAAHGIRVLREQDQLQPGDSIRHFMDRLAAGRCVLLILSADSLRSEYCMTELYQIWCHSQQGGEAFRRRIVPLVQEDARIGSPRERIAHAVHWKQEHQGLDALIREHGADVIGERDFARLKLIADFYRHVGDLLEHANDLLIPRDRLALAADNFAVVRGLIDRALSAGQSLAPR